MNKERLIKIVLFISVLLNLGFISAVAYNYYSIRHIRHCGQNSTCEIPETNLLSWYKQELNLSEKQYSRFCEENSKFTESAGIISKKMKGLRDSIFEEAMNENPDTSKINLLSEKMGKSHAELKMLSTVYFINLMKVCNKDRRQKLYDIFYSMQNAQSNMKCKMQKGPKNCGEKSRNF